MTQRLATFRIVAVLALSVTAVAGLGPVAAQSGGGGTRMLGQPVVTGDHVAFIYSGDLWIARLDGSEIRRLTTVREVSHPAFSPDGRLLAFSAGYDGNVDVYVVSAEGGAPRRLTWHPRPDLVQAFTPDGHAVLFTSSRDAFALASVNPSPPTQLFTVPADGGFETKLPIPSASRASFSPDGSRIAYNPLVIGTFNMWKHYRGGTASQIWLYDRRTHAIEKIPQPQGRSNDLDPLWVADEVYFRSDRDGEFNLYVYNVSSRKIRRLTSYTDFPVLNAGADPKQGTIVYEQAGVLHMLGRPGEGPRRLTLRVPADLRETRPRYVRGARYVRKATISPTGARVAFEFRGEIVTVPAEKGDPRNITNTPGVHERSPAWSPDGSTIAYLSDESGEYELRVVPQSGPGVAKRYKLSGHGFYSDLRWSPDGRYIAYLDNSQSIYIIDLATGNSRRVGGNAVYRPRRVTPSPQAWSPDSRWLAYAVNVHPFVETLFLYSLDRHRSYPVVDSLAEVSYPVFDRDGKYLYLLASTDAGPAQDWFALSSTGTRRTRSLYVAVLRKDLPSPLARESDEEMAARRAASLPRDSAAPGLVPGSEPHGAVAAGGASPGGSSESAAQRGRRDGPLSIDLRGIESRIVAFPIVAAPLSHVQVGDTGVVYFLRESDGRQVLHRYDLKQRKLDTLLTRVDDYLVSRDGKKLLYRQDVPDDGATSTGEQGADWFLISTTEPMTAGDGRLAVDDIDVRIDPRAEWAQMFDEAWRINRDYFYDPHMHGVDWPAMKRKYAAFLPDLATRADLNRLLEWIGSEMVVGHHYIEAQGDRFAESPAVHVGLLGADYVVERGRYRFKTIYGASSWNPDLRAPLAQPGVNVRPGDYLLAVNGRELHATTNLFSAFEATAEKLTELTVGPAPGGAGARTVQVVPVADEGELRHRAWIDDNLRKVDSATAGRVAYIYVPNTDEEGYSYFRRYFYPQAHKDALIVDERYNGGGEVADYFLDLLRRPLLSYWTTRHGADFKTPTASIQGPKVLLVNELAGSGGDFFPWAFRKLGLGPVIGQRTWGGLVGTLGYPVLMDGGQITAPDLAFWTPEEGWGLENVGVPPDIPVEQTPADVIAGRDPQLEAAIRIVMAELAKRPLDQPKRPPFPKKALGP